VAGGDLAEEFHATLCPLHRRLGPSADTVADGGDGVRAGAAVQHNAGPLVDQSVETRAAES